MSEKQDSQKSLKQIIAGVSTVAAGLLMNLVSPT